MGRVLSPTVVAHGVETKEQVDFLRALGCDQVQGFYFSKPALAAEFFEMLQAEDLELAWTTGNGWKPGERPRKIGRYRSLAPTSSIFAVTLSRSDM